jgi:integrase/recombinase XerD
MNQQPTITELIETISQSLEADGITAEYIKQLSYTWNVLKRYLSEHDLFFSKESGIMFLEEIYGISSAKGYANLRPVDRRRKRAIFILINCAEGISLYRKKTYWPCDFGESYVSVFSDFLNERKSHDFALSTINRDTPTTFRNTFSFPRYNSHV